MAGWYLISFHNPSMLRWWDGTQWTEHLIAAAPMKPAGARLTITELLDRGRTGAILLWVATALWLAFATVLFVFVFVVLGIGTIVEHIAGGGLFLVLLMFGASALFIIWAVWAIWAEVHMRALRRRLLADAPPPFPGLMPAPNA
ncbi:DUF2510 domain-containing protein [Microbacterium sp. NPDC076768]|uniref:DUF2510 domain-containing protein n=1 Tax=Microbacterium sp. NPDC076768 TaxID=3154858 RepID=UPI0034313034